jgi:hypothetical protein
MVVPSWESFKLEQPGEHANFVDIAKSGLFDGSSLGVTGTTSRLLWNAWSRACFGVPARYHAWASTRATKIEKVIVGKGTKSFIGIAGQIAAPLGLAAGTRDVPGKLPGILERL